MKFVIVVFCAVILVVSSQMISLEDLLKAYEISNSNIDTNEIGTGNGGNLVKVANEALFIPMSLRSCTIGGCNFICKLLGYKYGTCINSETCRCYT